MDKELNISELKKQLSAEIQKDNSNNDIILPYPFKLQILMIRRSDSQLMQV
ncbi:MAG: hypothetical protein JWP44_2791 [Mucilaginibacter sp.]|nr:hypothetical protein [Mucilaginibacter sp.]